MKNKDDFEREQMMFDATAVSVLQSVFKPSNQVYIDAAFKAHAAKQTNTLPNEEPAMGEGFSNRASVKFMITRQDEKGLHDLGYSQEEIDKIKPQEACDILQAGTKAKPAKGA